MVVLSSLVVLISLEFTKVLPTYFFGFSVYFHALSLTVVFRVGRANPPRSPPIIKGGQ